MSIHSELPPEQSNETLAAGSPPEPGAPHTVRADITPVSSTGAQCFGEYEVVGELGEGGMGRVYKARHRTLGQFVAVKVLTLNDSSARQRFHSEALTTAKLEHANIVRVIDVQIPPDGRPYLVMEFADGGSLDRELKGQPQNPYRAAEWLETIARAVHFAHENNVVHRDLKPANVLRGGGALKVTDFGLAKQLGSVSGLTQTGALLGTPSYMAPEQASGAKEVGTAADVYALGAILYEMLTGRPPFRGVDYLETLEQVRRDEPAPPSRLVPRLPRDLSVICLKCLEKAPGRRYHTAGELADDLKRWQNGQPIVARPASRWERLIRQIARRPWESAAIAASVLLVALLIGFAVYAYDEKTQSASKKLLDEADKANAKKIADAKAVQDKERDEEREQQRAKLKKQVDLSFKTIDGMRFHLMSGALKNKPGLDVLYKDLLAHSRLQIEELERDGVAVTDERTANTFEIGEMAFKVGEFETAKWAFEKAAAGYETLGRARDRGLALVKLARAQCDCNDLASAERTRETAAALWGGLTPAHPAEAKAHAAELDHLRGEILGRKYETKEALAAYTDAINKRKDLAAGYARGKPDDLAKLPLKEFEGAVRAIRELGRGYGFRADAYLWAGKTSDADYDYQESLRLRKLALGALDLRKLDKSKPPPAAADLEQAKQQVGKGLNNLARFQARHRAYATAKVYSAEALKLRDELVSGNSHNEEFAIDRLNNLTELLEFELLEHLGGSESADETAPAVAKLTAALADVERVALPNQVRAFRTREVLAEAHLARAEATAERKAAEALADLAVALQFLNDPELKHPKHAYQRAAANALKLDLDNVSRTDPKWEPVLTDLRAALAAGYRDRHPTDALQRRYFHRLNGDKRLDELLAQYGK